MRSIFRAFFLTIALFIGPAVFFAQQPQVLSAQLSTQALHGTLQATLDQLKQSATPLWVGYIVPTATPFRSGWNSDISYLEKHDGSVDEENNASPAERGSAAILFRLASGKIADVRAESLDRKLDGGGLRFVWLTGVSPEESVATLKTLCLAAETRHFINSSTFLISLHQSPAATPTLVALTAPGLEQHLREQASFWLASKRGHEGFVAIQHLAATDTDDAFRSKLVFDFTLSKDPGALSELVRIAHEDGSAHVRSQAQFWMANRGGKVVTASLHEAAETDPDAENRKKAVFAISRMPTGEATPQLVQLAETSKYPEVRKQAVFWLGQSHDPKALDFLTNLITSPSH